MSTVTLNLIAAACENMGIGVNGTLPWRLKKEMAYFTSMTTRVKDASKKNAVIMGRRSWDSIPAKFSPLVNRVNIVLTRHVDDVKKRVPEKVVVLPSMDEAVKYVEQDPNIEAAWVIGGADIYKAAMDHKNCGKIYLTEIEKDFECDTFFPKFDKDEFHLVSEDGVPQEKQVEGDISYYFRVYEKVKTLEALS